MALGGTKVRVTKTILKPCNCRNDYQDRTYGKGMRVKNTSGKTDKAKCTVCGKEQTL
jgi:hypothetical protein